MLDNHRQHHCCVCHIYSKSQINVTLINAVLTARLLGRAILRRLLLLHVYHHHRLIIKLNRVIKATKREGGKVWSGVGEKEGRRKHHDVI